jgi:hypothetical protein
MCFVVGSIYSGYVVCLGYISNGKTTLFSSLKRIGSLDGSDPEARRQTRSRTCNGQLYK